MVKPALFDVDEGEEVVLSRACEGEKTLREAMESFSIMYSERAIVTAYNAFNTKETPERILLASTENIKAYFKGYPQDAVTGHV
jgi:D-lactate dehydrogenase